MRYFVSAIALPKRSMPQEVDVLFSYHSSGCLITGLNIFHVVAISRNDSSTKKTLTWVEGCAHLSMKSRSQSKHRVVNYHTAESVYIPRSLQLLLKLQSGLSPFAGEYHNFQVLKKKDLGLKFDYLRKIMRNALCWLSLSAQI